MTIGLSTFAFALLSAAPISAPQPSSSATIRDQVCERGSFAKPLLHSDRPVDAGDDIVIIASRTNHNTIGQTLLVVCTGDPVKNVWASPDDGRRSSRGKEIFNPSRVVRLPGDNEPYLVIDFNYHQVSANVPDDSMFSNHQRIGPKICKYRVTVALKRHGMVKTLEPLYVNICETFVLTVKNLLPDEQDASQ